jgi:hypothetical protein
MFRLQEAQLQLDAEQEEDHGQVGAEEVLPVMQGAYAP